MTIFGVPGQAMAAQLMLGLSNGAFYALLSLGLAIIFGMLNVINFAHGAVYTLGAFVAWMLLSYLGIGFWPALFLAPLTVGLFGILLERTLIRQVYSLDPLYGLLLTYGIALIIQGLLRNAYGVSGLPYAAPAALQGTINLGFMFLPKSRIFIIAVSIVVCLAAWLLIEKTKLGSYLRAATENSALVEAFGMNVPLLKTLTYGVGVGIAGLAGVMAALTTSVSPNMGEEVIIVVFAVVVIGGMGSILGSVVAGFLIGLVEGLTKVFYPSGSATAVFAVMAIVLLLRPGGLFGKAA